MASAGGPRILSAPAVAQHKEVKVHYWSAFSAKNSSNPAPDLEFVIGDIPHEQKKRRLFGGEKHSPSEGWHYKCRIGDRAEDFPTCSGRI
jgi:hypothetical protein